MSKKKMEGRRSQPPPTPASDCISASESAEDRKAHYAQETKEPATVANGATKLSPEEQQLMVDGQWPMISDGDKKLLEDLAKRDALSFARMREQAAPAWASSKATSIAPSKRCGVS
jgi:hypothetical protein